VRVAAIAEETDVSHPMFPASRVLLWLTLGLALAPCLEAHACWEKFSKAEFTNCQQIASAFSLHWRIERGTIEFGISLSASASWVGLGLSEAGGTPTPSLQ
jgi:hypothetical protein